MDERVEAQSERPREPLPRPAALVLRCVELPDQLAPVGQEGIDANRLRLAPERTAHAYACARSVCSPRAFISLSTSRPERPGM